MALCTKDMKNYLEEIEKIYLQELEGEINYMPATEKDIQEVESLLKVEFPEGYREYQLKFGNADLWGSEIYSVLPLNGKRLNIFGITEMERKEAYPPMPRHLIPFSDNGGGDSYCFDMETYKSGICNVVFWDHEKDESQEPEILGNDIHNIKEYLLLS